MNEKIMVTICCTAYNHEKFIEKTIEGFLIQETNFNVEILITDDLSTDKTSEILKKYEEENTSLKVIYNKLNQYSIGKKPLFNQLLPSAKGKYIALCDGDDYWTDPLKLQKQIDFLENNSKYSACFTNARIVNEISGEEEKYLKFEGNKSYAIEEVMQKGGGLFPTASLIFKNTQEKWPDFIFKFKSGDRALSLILADKGDFYLLNDITCVYRLHEGGIFTNIKDNERSRNKIRLDNINLLKNFNQYTNEKYDNSIKQTISTLSKLILLKEKKSSEISKSELYKQLSFRDWLSFIKQTIIR